MRIGDLHDAEWPFFARIAPTLGVRFKPMRDLELRIQLGVSLTEGFFFSVGGNVRVGTSKMPSLSATN